MPEIVYVLTNEAMPGIVKIGRTLGNVQERMRSLFSTSLPLPFECAYAAEVDDSAFVERTLHALFSDHRISPNREFFRLTSEKVIIALRLAKHRDVTPSNGVFESPEQEQAVERARERRGRINLVNIGVGPGTVLTCSRDETVTAIVVDESRVEFKGERMSLSGAALLAIRNLGYQWRAVSGSDVWMVDGETLDERRRRLDDERLGAPAREVVCEGG
ncbi:MAG: GIY-YIG nuclease family protein [Burkholderiales bacterium]|nr:MAG: GIY-YIG nuclease family protein [Betaproteobacteria bacterium]TAG28551.1 MAG: GIY-YIG nuclease family protein [Burkholderiales bacterium]